MKYKSNYWKIVDSYELPKVIDRRFIDAMYSGKIDASGGYNNIQRNCLCGKDVRKIDMSSLTQEEFCMLSFDENTIFSEEQYEQFHPNRLLKQRQEYYSGIENLKKAGITGKGVKIAIIDEPFDHTLKQFRNVKYNDEKIKEKDINALHGNAVTSIIQNIAPESEISFYACTFEGDFKNDSPDIIKKEYSKFDDTRLAILSKIAENGNTDVISMSSSFGLGETSGMAGEKISQKLVEYFKKQNCAYIDSPKFDKDFEHVNDYDGKIHNMNVFNGTKVKYTLTDEEFENMKKEAVGKVKELETLASQSEGEQKKDYFEQIEMFKRATTSKEEYERVIQEVHPQKNNIKVISGGIVITQNDGEGIKKYCGNSSQSWAIPEVSAIYALAKQMDKNITYDEFIQTCMNTFTKDNVINPEEIVRQINEQNKEKSKTDTSYVDIYKNSSQLIDNLDRIKEEKSTEYVREKKSNNYSN